MNECMNGNLYTAHKNFHTKPSVFTVPIGQASENRECIFMQNWTYFLFSYTMRSLSLIFTTAPSQYTSLQRKIIHHAPRAWLPPSPKFIYSEVTIIHFCNGTFTIHPASNENNPPGSTRLNAAIPSVYLITWCVQPTFRDFSTVKPHFGPTLVEEIASLFANVSFLLFFLGFFLLLLLLRIRPFVYLFICPFVLSAILLLRSNTTSKWTADGKADKLQTLTVRKTTMLYGRANHVIIKTRQYLSSKSAVEHDGLFSGSEVRCIFAKVLPWKWTQVISRYKLSRNCIQFARKMHSRLSDA